MARFIFFLCILGCLLPAASATGAGTERTLQLEELWRVNVEDEEELIGVISAVISGPNGTVWLADGQLGQVLVYSAEGEHLRTLSREGEGPGEVSNPDGLLWLPGGGLGISDRKAGQLTHLDEDGMPLSSIHLTSVDGEIMASAMLSAVRCRGGVLAVAGTQFRFDSGAPTQSRFFGIFDGEGNEVQRLMEAPSGFDFEARTFHEVQDWFVDRGRFDLDADGRVHFVAERDRYRIHVHDARGELVQVIEREYEPWRRTAEEMERRRGGASMSINGEMVEIRSTVDDFAPAIEDIQITDDGWMWVLSGRGSREEREGILRSYDVFDGEGMFVEVVHLAVEIDEDQDQLHLLDDGRWILLRNITAAMGAMYGVGDDEGADELLIIVCLQGVVEPTAGK